MLSFDDAPEKSISMKRNDALLQSAGPTVIGIQICFNILIKRLGPPFDHRLQLGGLSFTLNNEFIAGKTVQAVARSQQICSILFRFLSSHRGLVGVRVADQMWAASFGCRSAVSCVVIASCDAASLLFLRPPRSQHIDPDDAQHNVGVVELDVPRDVCQRAAHRQFDEPKQRQHHFLLPVSVRKQRTSQPEFQMCL